MALVDHHENFHRFLFKDFPYFPTYTISEFKDKLEDIKKRSIVEGKQYESLAMEILNKEFGCTIIPTKPFEEPK